MDPKRKKYTPEIPTSLVIEKYADKIVFVLPILYVLFFVLVGILRYNLFDFGDFDLAVYSQIMWNMLHGSTVSSILGVPFLGSHTDLILFLFLPIYFIIKTPILLLIIQTLAVGLSGYLLYRFVSNLLNKTWAFLLVILFFMYPPLLYANLYEFHPIVIALPFLILCFSTYENEKFSHFVLYSTLAMLCKENIPLIIAMFGVLAIVDKKSVKWIITPALLGFSFFAFLVLFVKPYLNRGIIDFFILYKDFGDTPKDILLNMITSPGRLITRMFSIGNFKFVTQLISSVLFLPLLSLTKLIPVAMVFLQHFLSDRPAEKTIFYHYTVKFVPFLFISAAYGLKRLFSIKQIKALGPFATPFLFTAILSISIGINITTGEQALKVLENIPRLIEEKKGNFINQKFINLISREAAVVSTFRFLPKLSNRRNLYSFHHIYMGTYTFSSKPYPLPEELDYALIDFNDVKTFGFGSPHPYENLWRFFHNYNWQVIDFDGSTVLFKNSKRHNLNRLFQTLKVEPKIKTVVNGKINDEIELIGFNWVAGKGDKFQEAHFSFYWRCLKKTSTSYNYFFVIVNNFGEVIKANKQHMCYRIYPTHQWKEGEIIKEDYWYVFPSASVPKGKYYLTLRMFDETKRGIVKMESDKEELFDRGDFLILLKL